MPYTDYGRNEAIRGIKDRGAHISLHTGDPGGNGANEVTGSGYERKPTTWPTNPTSGSIQGSPVQITVPAGTTATHWGLWTAASGGTLIYQDALRNDQGVATPEQFGTAGTYSGTPFLSSPAA